MNSSQHSQSNLYYIKSLLNNQYLTLDKKDSLKYAPIQQQIDKNYLWLIKSSDQKQNFQQDFQLRFGEFVEISNKKNLFFSKNLLLIQQTNLEIISSQTFKRLNDNLLQKQPCVLIDFENQSYLTISDDKVKFLESSTPGSYFQLIPQDNDFVNQIQIQRPILNFSYEYCIRNYKTGYNLIVADKQDGLILSVVKLNKKKNQEKWSFLQITNDKFQIVNHFHLKYISIQNDLVSLTEENPHTYWKISTIDNKELTFGTPFIIQNCQTEAFLTLKEMNLKNPQNQEKDIFQSKILTSASLWIIFSKFI